MSTLSLPVLSRRLLEDLWAQKRADLELPPRTLLEAPEAILQIGTGKFMRGFVEDFVQLANAAGDYRGRVVSTQRRPDHRSAIFARQDGLYTLVMRGSEAGHNREIKRVIASLSRLLVMDREWEKVVAVAARPETRVILSNATEVGFSLDPADTPESKPPRSFMGKLTLLLFERWRASAGGEAEVAVIPCELVENNGPLVRSLIFEQAGIWNLGGAFQAWVEASVHVASTLVDRIVVGTPRQELLEAEWQTLGYRDEWVDFAEPFYLFAIEADDFTRRHFPLHSASPNVRFVDDLRPFRMRKLRLLNGPHNIMAPIGRLLGIETVRQAMTDPLLGPFMEKVVFEEIIPAMGAEDECANTAYAREVFERFRNPAIEHKLLGICSESTAKTGIRIFPSIRDYLKVNRTLPPRLLLAVAAMLLVLRQPEVQDAHGEYVREGWKRTDAQSRESLLAFTSDVLSKTVEWTHEALDVNAVAPAVADLLARITQQGLRAVLTQTSA
jgi:tagaturonate reductase